MAGTGGVQPARAVPAGRAAAGRPAIRFGGASAPAGPREPTSATIRAARAAAVRAAGSATATGREGVRPPTARGSSARDSTGTAADIL
jgi:hypothetical protein